MRMSLLLVIGMLVVVSGVLPLHAGDSLLIRSQDVEGAERVIGIPLNKTERDSLLPDLNEHLKSYQALRAFSLHNQDRPALFFNPIPSHYSVPQGKSELRLSQPRQEQMPANMEELAFYSVRDLSYLLRTGQITSLELTRFFLDRLKQYDDSLHCVITLTEERALREARHADAEIDAGRYRGPLHGIPYGAKDLLAAKGYKTTWGAMPYKNQVINKDAAVIQKLSKAGAVLVAKLSLGALAWGDVWYEAKTRNPWKLEQGSSGSSAGSAAATAAGLVPFAIGSETWGSIVSPSTRCGATGLRPTFGRVSRDGAMALSWSMDKLGPICRSVEDCAIVFNAIYGSAGDDRSMIDASFRYPDETELSNLRVGYLKSAFEDDYDDKEHDWQTLQTLRDMGVELIPVTLPDLPVEALAFILSAEAAAAFDTLTRSGNDDLMVRQVRNAWPNVFRAARFIPAVEYIQANRIRYQLIEAMHDIFKKVDLYVAPSFGGNNLLLTNLTGHPCVVAPNGFREDGTPTSISFTGNLFREGQLLTFAAAWQRATAFHQKHPPLFR